MIDWSRVFVLDVALPACVAFLVYAIVEVVR